jgi:tetratricopeptide (TPR) repeat protein
MSEANFDSKEQLLRLSAENLELARTLLHRNKPLEAISAYDKAQQLIGKLIDLYPDDPFPRCMLAAAHEESADAHRQLNDYDAAVREYNGATRLVAQIAVSHSNDSDWHGVLRDVALGAAHSFVADIRFDLAATVLQHALQAIDHSPTEARGLCALLDMQMAFAELQVERERPSGASHANQAALAYHDAISTLTALLRTDPSNPEWAYKLCTTGEAAFNLWLALDEVDNAAEALSASRHANIGTYRRWRDCYSKLALAQMAKSRWQDAIRSLDTSLTFCYPEEVRERASIKSHTVLVLLHLGEIQEARRLAMQIVKLCRFRSWFSDAFKSDLAAARYFVKCCDEDQKKAIATADDIIGELLHDHSSALHSADRQGTASAADVLRAYEPRRDVLGDPVDPAARALRQPAGRSAARGKKSEPAPPVVADFLVTAPPVAPIKHTFGIELWVAPSSLNAEMRKEAIATGTKVERAKRLGLVLPSGSVLSATLSLPGFTVDEPTQELSWTGQIANIAFLVTAGEGTLPGRKCGRITIVVEKLPIAAIMFDIDLDEDTFGDAREEIPSSVRRIHRAFASYASADRQEVLGRVQGMRAVGVEVFVDILNLRAGARWEPRLYYEIARSDAMFLFWSEAANSSKHVGKEWRFALEHRGLDFIQPIPLVDPSLVPPPKELESTHFNDLIAVYLGSQKSGARAPSKDRHN